MELDNRINKKIKSVDLIPLEVISAADYYLSARQGHRAPFYIHQDLEPVLNDTYGVMVFQEQVMKVLVNVANYTMEEADLIRSAIGKKKREVMVKAFGRIRETVISKGWTEEQANQLCEQIEAFSGYGFNQAHAAEYAELGYITMYLKHYHITEWWTSILNSHIGKEDKLRDDISYLKKKVLSASIQNPCERFTIVGDKIATPLSIIKGLGQGSLSEIISKAPYTDINSFISKVDHRKVNSGVISALIKARVFDCMYDLSLPYGQAKIDFIEKYKAARLSGEKKRKIEFPENLMTTDPVEIFLQEKEMNTTFNKNLLENEDIIQILMNKWPSLKRTGNPLIPIAMGNKVHVLLNVNMAERLLEKGETASVGMILIFESSSFSSGVSKKSGRAWKKLSVILSDGYNQIEAVNWDANYALGWKAGTIVYVKGTLKEGFKYSVTLNIEEIEEIQKNS